MNKGRIEYEQLRVVLRRARLDADLSQEQLAERLGVRQEWISRYEVGERRLDVVELSDVASALGVNVVDILDRAGIRTSS